MKDDFERQWLESEERKNTYGYQMSLLRDAVIDLWNTVISCLLIKK